MNLRLKLEILQGNYQEHFKYEKELSLILSLDHPKRVALHKECNLLIKEITELQQKINTI